MSRDMEMVINQIAELRKSGSEFCVATIVRTAAATSAKAGAKAVITSDGEIKGFVGGACVQSALKKTAAEVLYEGSPRLIRVKPKDEAAEGTDVDGVELHKSSCPSGGTVELFVEPMLLAPQLIVCGSSPVALAVFDLGARLGYRVSLASTANDLPKPSEIKNHHKGFDLTSLDIGHKDFVVVATQGNRDKEALYSALLSNADYVAFVGSRKKAEIIKLQLQSQGVTSKQLKRLSAPAGINIHAIEPEEIAISILSEIINHRRQSIKSVEIDPADVSRDGYKKSLPG